jgi:hypothetical protein
MRIAATSGMRVSLRRRWSALLVLVALLLGVPWAWRDARGGVRGVDAGTAVVNFASPPAHSGWIHGASSGTGVALFSDNSVSPQQVLQLTSTADTSTPLTTYPIGGFGNTLTISMWIMQGPTVASPTICSAGSVVCFGLTSIAPSISISFSWTTTILFSTTSNNCYAPFGTYSATPWYTNV